MTTDLLYSSGNKLKQFVRILGKVLCIGSLALAFGAPVAHAASKKPQAKKTLVAASAKQKVSRVKVQMTAKNRATQRLVASSSSARKGRGQVIVVSRAALKDARGRPLKGQALAAARRRGIILASLPVIPAKQSFGELAGLHSTQDSLDLKSSVALVVDQDTHEVLFSKNDSAVLPIASLTKLMTGLIISEAKLPMNELLTITQDDVDTEKGSRSRLTVGTTLARSEMLHLALMSSENRAAHALGRTYPGGLAEFVRLMNAKAKLLGMNGTRYVEPTGLSSNNQSSAQDLAVLVNAAYKDAAVREYSTSPGYEVAVGAKTLQFNTTNQLVKNPGWDIGVQKTGYISEAGRCLVMQTKIAGRKIIMVFLDSAGKFSRLGDAERVRRWVESNPVTLPVVAKQG